MCGVKRIILLWVIALFINILSGCGYERHFFEKEELRDYVSPIVFLKDSDSKETYFIFLNEPEKKYYLEYEGIYDYKKENQTFLFSIEKEGDIYIAEYDLKEQKYTYIVDENSIKKQLNLENDELLKSIHYFPKKGKLSFSYGQYLLIYDIEQKEYIYQKKVFEYKYDTEYGWKNCNIVLLNIFDTIYEFDIESNEKKRIESRLGKNIVLSADKNMASSIGDENWFGVNFMPVLLWDTQNYEVKRFHEGVTIYGRTQLSEDYKYIMFAQEKGTKDSSNQLLCLKVEDESICVIYETKDTIIDVLW